jgi:hypothetical protein
MKIDENLFEVKRFREIKNKSDPTGAGTSHPARDGL